HYRTLAGDSRPVRRSGGGSTPPADFSWQWPRSSDLITPRSIRDREETDDRGRDSFHPRVTLDARRPRRSLLGLSPTASAVSAPLALPPRGTRPRLGRAGHGLGADALCRRRSRPARP